MIFKLNKKNEPKLCCYLLWDNKKKIMAECGKVGEYERGKRYLCGEHVSQAGYAKMEFNKIKEAAQ
jgi:hypothetical protein